MEIKCICPSCHCTEWECTHTEKFKCLNCGNEYYIHEMNNVSEFYVYMMFCDDWGVPFYIGKGIAGRYKDFKNRSKRVTAIINNFKCHSEIIRYCATEKESLELEKTIKKDYIAKGFPIIDAETPKQAHILAQREGIEKARHEGKYKGRAVIQIPNFRYHYNRYMNREVSKSALAKELNISRPTLNKLILQMEDNDV